MGAAARLDPTQVRVADLSRDPDRSVRARPAPQPAQQARPRLHQPRRRVGGVLRGAADRAARARLRRRRVSLRVPGRRERRQRLRAQATASRARARSCRRCSAMTAASVAVKLLLGCRCRVTRAADVARERRALGRRVVHVARPRRCAAAARAPARADELAAYLQTGRRAPTKRPASARSRRWIVDETTWQRDDRRAVSRALRRLRRRRSPPQVPALVAQLAPAGAVTARRHFAGDPRLTPAQARAALGAAGAVPERGRRARRRADRRGVRPRRRRAGARSSASTQLVLAHVAALDPACAAQLALAGPPGRCTEVGWRDRRRGAAARSRTFRTRVPAGGDALW